MITTSPSPFDLDEAAYAHLLGKAAEVLRQPLPPVRRRWAGVYSEMLDKERYLYWREEIFPRTEVINGPGGRGMTCSPAIAEASVKSLAGSERQELEGAEHDRPSRSTISWPARRPVIPCPRPFTSTPRSTASSSNGSGAGVGFLPPIQPSCAMPATAPSSTSETARPSSSEARTAA